MADVLNSIRYDHVGWDRLKQNVYYREDVRKLTREQRRILFKHERQRNACNRRIFGQVALEATLQRQIISLEIAENYAGFRLPEVGAGNTNGGDRGKIQGFSGESRIRMLKDHASLLRYPRIWQDFTFADDVMRGKSITDRAEYSSAILHNWQRWAGRKYKGVWGTWKREWVPRKSGLLVGEWVPHFHIVWDWQDLNLENWLCVCVDFALKWVQLTGTEDERAAAVAINTESYRWLHDKHMAQVYVSKYVAKPQFLETSESLGRFWGRIGKPPKGKVEEKRLDDTTLIWLSRLLPKLTRRFKDRNNPLEGIRRNDRLERGLGRSKGWLMVSRQTIEKLIAWSEEQERIVIRCPF